MPSDLDFSVSADVIESESVENGGENVSQCNQEYNVTITIQIINPQRPTGETVIPETMDQYQTMGEAINPNITGEICNNTGRQLTESVVSTPSPFSSVSQRSRPQSSTTTMPPSTGTFADGKNVNDPSNVLFHSKVYVLWISILVITILTLIIAVMICVGKLLFRKRNTKCSHLPTSPSGQPETLSWNSQPATSKNFEVRKDVVTQRRVDDVCKIQDELHVPTNHTSDGQRPSLPPRTDLRKLSTLVPCQKQAPYD